MTAPASIDSRDLNDRLSSAAPPRVLDVRTPGEFQTAHIAGAYNVPLDLLREHATRSSSISTSKVVLVCRSGQRAAQAEETLRTAGLDNVHILEGGITAGRQRVSRPTEARSAGTSSVRCACVAGSIVLTSILGSLAVPKLKWLAAGIGAGLAAAALTNTCAMGMALSRLPYNRGATCEPSRPRPNSSVRPAAPESELTAMIAMTIGLAVLVGISLGLLGGGGSILTVPLLAYVAGMEPTHAIAMSLLVVGVTSAIAAITHARAGRVRWRVAVLFGLVAMAGAYAGGRLARFIPGRYCWWPSR